MHPLTILAGSAAETELAVGLIVGGLGLLWAIVAVAVAVCDRIEDREAGQ